MADAGLLGSVLAGATKRVSEGRLADIAKREDFDLKMALMDAQVEKEMRLKEAGYEFDKRKEADQEASNRATMDRAFAPVEETSKTPESVMNKYVDENGQEQVTKAGGETVTKTREATSQDAAQRLAREGKFEQAKGLLSLGGKERSYESVKLDDGSVLSFDKSTGTGKIVYQGGKSVDVPKSELELAWRQAGGDPDKAAKIIVEQKARVAAAGRAPEKASDDDLTFADWKKKPENKGKGRDDYAKEKARWSKDGGDNMDEVTTKTIENDKFGRPVGETTRKTREPKKTDQEAPKNNPKPWERTY
jgi:hypothetical protein